MCVCVCVLQPCKLLNGVIPAQVAMASAVALLSSPPAMGVKGQGQGVCVCVCVSLEMEYPVVPLCCKHSLCALPSNHCHVRAHVYAVPCMHLCMHFVFLCPDMLPGPRPFCTHADLLLCSGCVLRKFARSCVLRLALLSLSKPCKYLIIIYFRTPCASCGVRGFVVWV